MEQIICDNDYFKNYKKINKTWI